MKRQTDMKYKRDDFKEKVNSLTSIRFMMMLMILVSHLDYFQDNKTYSLHLDNAYMAVNYFFMVSGFGLTYTTLINNKKVYEISGFRAHYKYAFLKVKKIYILYIITMLVYIPLQMYTYMITDGRSLIYGASLTTIKILSVMPMLQSVTGRSSFTHALNSVGWFLSTLFILYMFYPKIQQWNRKKLTYGNKIKFRIIILILLYFIISKLLYGIEDISFFDTLEYCSPFIRSIPFVIGILLCDILFMESRRDIKSEQLGTLYESLILICVVVWFCLRNVIYIEELGDYILVLKEIVDIIIVAVLIYVFSHENGKISKFLNSGWCITLGNATMYIYLIHYPVISYLRFIFEKIMKINNLYSRVLMTILTFIFTGALTAVSVWKSTQKRGEIRNSSTEV